MIVPTARAARGRPVRAASEPLGLALGLGVERDAAETPVGDGDEQRPNRRVGDVVRDVEQPSRGGCVAELPVKRGGDGGHVSLLLSRRTPDEAAWRAASSLEFSASAICSYG